MKIATWNVNSLRVRLPQLTSWLDKNQPDIIGLQETKVTDDKFPLETLHQAGYYAVYTGEKTYNGVALLSRHPLTDVAYAPEDWPDSQCRIVRATYAGTRILNLYVPNGSEVASEKYHFKLAWMEKMRALLAKELLQHTDLAVIGDFNLAPEDRDVHDPLAWQNKILCSQTERSAYTRWLDLGLNDAFRIFPQADNLFSWWDYRAAGFRRNQGLRIDHILVSKTLQKRCTACWIDREPRAEERPSDHAPVIAQFTSKIERNAQY